MLYNDFKGVKLSALGLGAMRLPTLAGKDSQIDENASRQMFDYALKNGINYFDTAYMYHGGSSETMVGKILSDYDRESFNLATKFPGYDSKNISKPKEIFEEQLEKCKTDYFDFYLIHNVCEENVDLYIDGGKKLLTYLLEQKKEGRIKHLGFSIHGDMNVMKKFLSVFGEHMEFCQIQLNYIDYHFQDAKAKVEYCNSIGLPVWVMEPIRGGKLANIPEKNKEMLKKLRPDESVVGWGFRYLQTIPGVKMVLSGMSNMEQLEQNIKTFSEYKPLSNDEFKMLNNMGDSMVNEKVLPCTACRYCTHYCPNGLDIPHILSLYNELVTSHDNTFVQKEVSGLDKNKRPNKCISCGGCEKVCPQNIKISKAMKDFSQKI